MSSMDSDPAMSAAVAEVDASALRHNVAAVRAAVGAQVEIMAVVKANAYGHGLVGTAEVLAGAGVRRFGVATPTEALTLRSSVAADEVLLLSPVHEPGTVRRLVAEDVSLTVPGPEAVEVLRSAGPLRDASVHLKLDTGMGRLGARSARQARSLAGAVASTPGVTVRGTFTHLYASEDEDPTATLEQLDLFSSLLEAIEREGVDPGVRHAANSAATLRFPQAAFDMVRPGIVLYGHYPGPLLKATYPGLRQAMTFTAPVSFVKRVAAGTSVSYGGLWRADRETVIATVRAGYADGYRRSLTGVGWVGHGGSRLPVVGRVCMDQLMVDATGSELAVGDRVVLWGPDGPDPEELGAAIGTVSYEMLTGVAARVGRIVRAT